MHALDSVRLPDQITVDHGPASLFGRFFLAADRAARERGVYLHLHTEFDSLLEVNRRTPEWGALVPIFNPEYSLLKPDAAFWIEGRNAAGETVATQAARLYLMRDTTLEDELLSLRFFYADAAARQEAGERFEVTAPSAGRISGRVVFSGGIWYRPDYRGIGLSSIMPRISRAYAYTRWMSDYTISMVAPVLVEKGVVGSYGYRRVEPEVRMLNSFRGDSTYVLVWMTGDELIDDLDEYFSSSPILNRALANEVPETKTSPVVVLQGRRRRS
jgi:hypothetical protein